MNETATNATEKKVPMSVSEFFKRIDDRLRGHEQLPEILDYGIPSRETLKLTSIDFCLDSRLDYGGSEGIYLDLWLTKPATKERYNFGTYKTLEESPEAMREMGKLLADFIVNFHDYLDHNADDFDFEGYNIYPVKEDGTRNAFYYIAYTKEDMQKRKDELLCKYPRVIVRHNPTREEQEYVSEGGGTDENGQSNQ